MNTNNQLNNIVRKVNVTKILLICGDFSGNIGKLANGYEGVHGIHGYGSKNKETIFAVAHNIDVHQKRQPLDNTPVRWYQYGDRIFPYHKIRLSGHA